MSSFRAELARALAIAGLVAGLPLAALAQTSADTRPVTGAPRQLGQPVDTIPQSSTPGGNTAAPEAQPATPTGGNTTTAPETPEPPPITVPEENETAPPPVPPSGNNATTVPAAPPVLGQPSEGAVTVAPLGASEGSAAGTLDDTNGGFDSNLWSDLDRATANELLTQMPATTEVPGLRALAKRLLLTKADAPTGNAEHSFLTIRLRKMLDAGLIDEAGAIAAAANVQDDAEFARVQADAILYANRASDACGTATAMRLTSSEPFWIELRAYCYAAAGNSSLLDLTRSVMNAQNLSDPAFDKLLDDVVSKKTAAPGDIPAPTSLDLFLLRQAAMAVPPDLASGLGDGASLIAMRDTADAPNDRLDAGEHAISTGAVSNDELTALADAAQFTPGQLAHALDVTADMPFLKAEALLRQAGLKESDHSRKVQLALQALQLGDQKGSFEIAAVLERAPAAAIKPIRAMRPMAPIIIRALLVAGDADSAERWMKTLDPKADAAMLARFEAEANLVASTPERQARAQTALALLATQIPAPNAPARTDDQALDALILGVYATNGEPMPQAARSAEAAAQGIVWQGRRPAPAQIERLDKALSTRGAKGEALVTVLNIVGAQGPGDLAPDVTLDLATALVEEGLADTARSFAISAMLAKPQS